MGATLSKKGTRTGWGIRLRAWVLSIRSFLREARWTLKHEGPRGFVRKYGWKIVVAVILFYLVRDVVLYLLLPWLLISEFV